MKLVFQIIDVDYFTNGDKPVTRLFGRTDNDTPITVLCKNFMPYFYIKEGPNVDKIEDIGSVVATERVEKFPAVGYTKDKIKLLKVIVKKPQEVRMLREQFLSMGIADEIFEADILFKNRFLVDHNIHGMDWVEAEVSKISTHVVSGITYELSGSINTVEKKENCDLSIMAFDIECVPSDTSRALDSKKDPIVMISLAFNRPFRDMKDMVIVAKPTTGKNVQGFINEKEMLEYFVKIIEDFNPDVITGYNLNAFDVPYVLDRLQANSISPMIGRVNDKPAYVRNVGIIHECTIPGRVVVDPYQILRRDPWVKFSRYNLNTIAKELLGDEKHDVDYKEMPKLWNGSKEDLDRFVEYSRQDALLTLRLVVEKNMLDKFIEIAKISGTVLQDCFGGQTLRIDNMLLYEFNKNGYVMPSKPDKKEMSRRVAEREKHALKGATVLSPKKGLHAEGCTMVLDFKSLYPSIMRTFNISPDTIVNNKNIEDVGCYESPFGSKFIPTSVKEGMFPRLVTLLLESRSKAKKEMDTANEEEKRVLNAKQLALKDLANSFYGYTGYVRARAYDIGVASSITAIGRENIEKTRDLVEKNFDVDVVYGDTDSIFVKAKMTNMEETKKLGDDISKFVSDKLPGHLMLEFEKIYRTFLILTKKRYAGWKFEWDGKEWSNDIDMKGIETVRRDWCPLVSKTTEDILNIILKEGDLKKAVKHVQVVIERIKNNDVPLDELTIIKGITKSPENYEGMLPHIELAKKLAKRNPHDPPKIGDRLGFVIIRGNQMLSKRAEDPDYVKENKLQVDPEYYINSQVFPPIERIFSSIGIDKGEVFGNGRQASISDIMLGTKRKMKHDINIDYGTLSNWEELNCEKCGKSYSRMPLVGSCECGGQLLFSYQGNSSKTLVNDQ
jgi:DNA polymerase, archaea type